MLGIKTGMPLISIYEEENQYHYEYEFKKGILSTNKIENVFYCQKNYVLLSSSILTTN